tara:strand:- start:297 stop:710 length:414 start_codon:yes stop_codon:yes gene_type:complete
MNVKQRAAIGVVAVLSFVYFTNSDKFSSSGLTNDEVKVIIEDTTESFSEAEREILGEDPDPPKPCVPSGPDPDPKKCICKGTGKIVQGDGHVSTCPYHGVKEDVCPEPTSPSHSPAPTKSYNKSRRGIFGGRLFGRK